MSDHPAATHHPGSLGKVSNKAVPLRIVLYILTVASAVAALFLEPALAAAVARGAISPRWLFLPVAVYGLFFLAYAVDRIWLLRKRHYPVAKAFFQIAFGLMFASLLLPSTIQDYQGQRRQGIARLLGHADPEIRESAVYALGYKGPNRESVSQLMTKLDDDDPRVRTAALIVLSQWAHLPRSDATGVRVWASALSKTSSRAVSTSSSGESFK